VGESTVKISKRKAATVVAISGPMTIANIGELKDGLLKAFNLGKKVQLSVAAVTDVDVTGLQLLCSCHRTSIAKDLEFSITGVDGAAFATVTGVAGMMRNTGCDQDLAGSCIWKQDV
jgi:anti-anti-sigma regulatory factor